MLFSSKKTPAEMPLDFLAIGDVVTEPFIRLTEAHVTSAGGVDEVCMRFGDKIPYESATVCVAVGNASNAAVAAARLGLGSALHAYVGDDRYGVEIREKLVSEKVGTEHLVTEPGKISNYHYVLWYGTDRTILVKHEEYSYAVPQLAASPKWVYLSSLSANSKPYHDALAAWLDAHPTTKLAFQPGTFQMSLGVDALRPLYARAAFLAVNVEEAERILGFPAGTPLKELLAAAHALGPQLVVITDGARGAYAYDGAQMLHVPVYPDTRPPFERTGAGDAFASSVVAALAEGLSFHEALLWGPVNSMSVVQQVGAQAGLLTRAELDELLAKAPPEYVVTPLA